MKNEDLKKLHNAELKILQVLIDVCAKLNIQFFAVYGTALGAIRHKGFIPWDDDIDVGMLRKDFTRFVHEAPAILPEGMTLHFRDSDPKYYLMHAKLRDDNTTFIENDYKEKAWNHHGIFIDIFPWDYMPDTFLSKCCFFLKKRFYQNLIVNDYTVNYWESKKTARNILYALLQPVLKRFFPDKMVLVRKLDAVMENLSPSSLVCEHQVSQYVYPAEWYKDIVFVPFENMQIPVPVKCHEILTAYYGDYMTPPPAEFQVPFHFGGTMDDSRPFTYYLSKLVESRVID